MERAVDKTISPQGLYSSCSAALFSFLPFLQALISLFLNPTPRLSVFWDYSKVAVVCHLFVYDFVFCLTAQWKDQIYDWKKHTFIPNLLILSWHVLYVFLHYGIILRPWWNSFIKASFLSWISNSKRLFSRLISCKATIYPNEIYGGMKFHDFEIIQPWKD